MPQFTVDEDLASLVEKLAKPKPFENLSFNNALRRVLHDLMSQGANDGRAKLERLIAEAKVGTQAEPKKAPSPSATHWAQNVGDLKNRRELTTWKAICVHLKIDTSGDSARRKLRNWVKANRPTWPAVPEIDGD